MSSFLRSTTDRKPSSSSEPMSPVCSQPSSSISSAVRSGRLRYPGVFSGLRVRISPSAAILTSTPGTGRPTVPSRNAPGVFVVNAPVVSVIPYTSRIFMPSPAKNSPTSGGSGAAAAGHHLGLAQAEQGADRLQHARVGPAELLGQVVGGGVTELAAAHVPAADVHRRLDGGPPGRVLLAGHQRLDARLDLLPDPGHAEEIRRLGRAERSEQAGSGVVAEVHVPGQVHGQVDAEDPLGDVGQRQVGHAAQVRQPHSR